MQAPGDLTHEKRKKKKTENTMIEVGEDCSKPKGKNLPTLAKVRRF